MKWPDSLVSDIASRRAVLFIGSGVSMNSVAADGVSRPSSWTEFLRQGARKLGRPSKPIVKQILELVQRNDLLTACEVIKNQMGRENFVNYMKASFQEPGFRPASIHESLWLLDLRITITPNIDNIYDNLVAERGAGTVTTKTFKDDDVAEAIRRRERVLIKSHGTIGAPNALIFTRSDYAKARNDYRGFYELMYSLLSTHTFIFIGCGLEDPDIRSLLEDYRYRNPFGNRHYFTLPSGYYRAEVTKVHADSLNLEFIKYKSTSNHAELSAGLKQLVNIVNLARQEIGQSQSW